MQKFAQKRSLFFVHYLYNFGDLKKFTLKKGICLLFPLTNREKGGIISFGCIDVLHSRKKDLKLIMSALPTVHMMEEWICREKDPQADRNT